MRILNSTLSVIGQIITDSLISTVIIFYPLQLILPYFNIKNIDFIILFIIVFILKIVINNVLNNIYLTIILLKQNDYEQSKIKKNQSQN